MDQSKVAVVIEDDGDIAELLESILQRSGAVVHTACTGAAGIEAVRVHRPRLITLDQGLPDIDGCEVARRIRDFSDAHILLVSAQTDKTPAKTTALYAAGVSDVMTKPFSPRELRRRAEAVLGTS
jgi:two-component system, OmpR family, response regulator